MRTLQRRITIAGIALVLTGLPARCQSVTLALSSGTVPAGGTASLNLSLTSTSGSQPAGLQWTLTYPTSAIISITATAGSAATAASKSIYCLGSGGSYTCLLTGINKNTIQNGVVAVVTVTTSASATGATIGITNPLGASPTASPISIQATGGTVTVTGSGLTQLSCSPTSLGSLAQSTCTVRLSGVAPSGGVTVALTDNSAFLTVPGSVLIGSGSTSATFTATSGTITANQTAVITASANGVSVTTSLSLVSVVTVSSLACTPSSLGSHSSATCTVTLNRQVSVVAQGVQVTSSSSHLTVPASVTVPVGAATAAFTATAGRIYYPQSVTVTAKLGSSSQSTSLSLSPSGRPAVISSVSCNNSSPVGGTSGQCSVVLSHAAPAGGAVVRLNANQPALSVPGSVEIPEGAPMASFAFQTRPSDHAQAATITAITAGSASQTSLSLLPLKPAYLSCAPQDARAPQTLQCEVGLNAPPDAPATLAVYGSGQVKLPATLTTRPGQSSLTFQAVVTPSPAAREVSVQVGFGAQIATNSRWISPSSAPPLSVPANVFARVGEPIDLALVQPGSGEAPVPLSASGLPPGARFDAPTARLSWTPDRSEVGSYDLAFTTPAGGTASSAHMKITVGSGEPVATELVNAASQSPDSVCSPGSVASLLGQWLNNADDPVNATAPRVYVNGSVAPVLSATSTRVDFVCPDGTPGAQLQVWLENNSGKTAPLTTMLRNSAPGIFTLNGSTQGLILLDGSVPATVRSFASSGQPAQPGDEVAIRATGFGPDAVVSVKLGDVEAPVLSVSPVNNLPGVYDIRVKLPAGVPVGDTVPALLRVAGNSGGSSESNPATMAIELPRP